MVVKWVDQRSRSIEVKQRREASQRPLQGMTHGASAYCTAWSSSIASITWPSRIPSTSARPYMTSEDPVSRVPMSDLQRGSATMPQPLAIMGVRRRVRHQAIRRARGTCVQPVLPELRVNDHSLPITLVSYSRRFQAGSHPPPTPERDASSGSTSCHLGAPLRPVDLAARQQCPGDARHPVRERYGGQPHRPTCQHTS